MTVLDLLKAMNNEGGIPQILGIDMTGNDEDWIYGKVMSEIYDESIYKKIREVDSRIFDREIRHIFMTTVYDEDCVEFAKKKGVEVKIGECEMNIELEEEE